ncbi:MAG: V-type ATP synthase subunit D [Candidatus Paceibacterota bacterium]
MLKVNPTRVNLLALKKRLKTAKKGHKLLKDKRDGLIQKFMQIIKETRELRRQIDQELGTALHTYVRGSSMISKKVLDVAFMVPTSKVSLDVSTESVMAVSIPRFTVHKNGNGFSYGFLETNGDIDRAISQIDEVFPALIKLAELEKAIENLADEIEKTRRRTNALENVMIPNLNSTIRYITTRLEEQQRDAVVASMKIKDMITAQSVAETS